VNCSSCLMLAMNTITINTSRATTQSLRPPSTTPTSLTGLPSSSATTYSSGKKKEQRICLHTKYRPSVFHGKRKEFTEVQFLKIEFRTSKPSLIDAICHSLEVNCDTKPFVFELSKLGERLCVRLLHCCVHVSVTPNTFFFLFSFFPFFFCCLKKNQ